MGTQDEYENGGMVDDVAGDVAAAMAELRGEAPEQPDAERGEDYRSRGDQPGRGDRPETRRDEAAEPGSDEGRAPRDPRGRFARRRETEEERRGEIRREQAGDERPGQAQPWQEQPEKMQAPESWMPAARAKWQNVPNDIKAEIHRRESEIAAYGDPRQLRPMAELAASRGTTVADALDYYASIDRLMSKDLGGGLALCCERYGYNREQIGQLFADMARRYGVNVGPSQQQPGQYQPNGHQAPGGQHQNGQQPNGQSAVDNVLMEILAPVINPLMSELNAIKEANKTRSDREYETNVNSLANTIQTFADDPANKYYYDVERDINDLFERGAVPLTGNHMTDLKNAYEMAIWRNPHVRQALTDEHFANQEAERRKREQDAANAARRSSRSIGGNSAPGAMYKPPQQHQQPGTDDVMADVVAAMQEARSR